MTLNDWTNRNHAEFVAWTESGKAKRLTQDEARVIVQELRLRAVQDNLTREQARQYLLDRGLWLSIDPSGIEEWVVCARPIFLNLEGKLQKVVAQPPELDSED